MKRLVEFLEEQIETEIPISLQEFEEMAQRVYNIYKDALREYGYKNWKQWLEKSDAYELSLSFESEYAIYDKYLRNLPEEIRAIDLIKAYKSGKLKSFIRPQYQHQQMDISPTGVRTKVPWSSQKRKAVTIDQAKKIFTQASQRITKSTQPEITEARKQLFILFHADEQLSEKIGITKSELNKRIKTYAGYPVSAVKLEKYINHGIPEEHQWVGISNSSFISRQTLKPEDIDKFVKQIEVTNEGTVFWSGDRGKILRQYIARAFLGINSGLKYSELSFKIGKCKPSADTGRSPRGIYESITKTITISDINPHTVAHEIGHYLDHLFADEIEYMLYGKKSKQSINGLASSGLVALTNPEQYAKSHKVPVERLQWASKYIKFVNNLTNKGDISSEYTQRSGEVFARFINFFVNWTVKKAGDRIYDDGYRDDKFTEMDCRTWIRLLQEKSYVDTKYPLKNKK